MVQITRDKAAVQGKVLYCTKLYLCGRVGGRVGNRSPSMSYCPSEVEERVVGPPPPVIILCQPPQSSYEYSTGSHCNFSKCFLITIPFPIITINQLVAFVWLFSSVCFQMCPQMSTVQWSRVVTRFPPLAVSLPPQTQLDLHRPRL